MLHVILRCRGILKLPVRRHSQRSYGHLATAACLIETTTVQTVQPTIRPSIYGRAVCTDTTESTGCKASAITPQCTYWCMPRTFLSMPNGECRSEPDNRARAPGKTSTCKPMFNRRQYHVRVSHTYERAMAGRPGATEKIRHGMPRLERLHVGIISQPRSMQIALLEIQIDRGLVNKGS
jgi:hypothetical protein